MDNAPSIPNRAGTKVEAAGRRWAPPHNSLVRGSPSHSTKLSQSQPEPNKAAALQPPDAIPGHIRSISVLLKPESAPLVALDIGSQGARICLKHWAARRANGEVQAAVRSVESPSTRFRPRRRAEKNRLAQILYIGGCNPFRSALRRLNLRFLQFLEFP